MFFTARRQPPAALAAAPTAVIAQPAMLDDDRKGCGWYDSSFELSQGLEVSDAPDGLDFDLWLLALDVAVARRH